MGRRRSELIGTWQIRHAANQVIRQIGILMFLACAGLRSGTAFADAIVTRHGLELVLAGLVLGAALAYALDRTDGDGRVSRAYALVFPIAMVAKIVVAQLLV